MTPSPSRRERQHRIEPVEGLDGALFVHAEDGGMGWRGQIQSDDVHGFRFESWIVGSHEVSQPMRVAARGASRCERRSCARYRVCAPDDGCSSECSRHWGRAASTPALWPPERPHWLLPYARDAGRQDRSSAFGGSDWSSAEHTKVLHPKAPAISRTLCRRALLKMTSARRASSERTLRERRRRLSSRRSGGLNRRLDAIQQS